MSKYAFLIIDMQNAYFNNEALEQKRSELTAACNKLVTAASQRNIPVFNVVTKHKRDHSTWTLNMLEDGRGYLFEGDDDAANIDGLKLDSAMRVVKTRDSAFHGTALSSLLQDGGVDTVILAGVSTHTCVMQTAADAYAHNYEVLIAKDAVATHDPAFHESALALLKKEYRQDVYESIELIERLKKQ